MLNPVEVKNLVRKRIGVSETDIIDHIYGLVTKYATRSGIPSQKAIENNSRNPLRRQANKL
jgi:hypothetical protein